MEAKDLRLGNLVQFKDRGIPLEITEITDEGLFTDDGYWVDGHLKPIKLTEEWLLKMKDNPNKASFPDWMEYVHEAQNWYYWNNNKTELIISD